MTGPEWICDRCGWPVTDACTCPPDVEARRLAREVAARHREAVQKARRSARRAA